MKQNLETFSFFEKLKINYRLIITITFASTLLGVIVSYFYLVPVYQARTDLLINQAVNNTGISVISPEEIESNLKLIESYQYIVKSDRIMQIVSDKTQKLYTSKELTEKVKIETNGKSQILSILVEDSSAENAANIANTIAQTFQNEIRTLMKLDNVHTLSIATADKQTKPIRPNILFNGFISFFGGAMFAISIILYRAYFKTKK